MLDSKHFPVLQNAPFIWVGHSVLYAPYRMVRLCSVHSHVIASIAGHGRTLIGGKSVVWQPGQVLLAPIGMHHAFEPVGQEPWCIAWVFFNDNATAPALRGRQPELVNANGSDFAAILQMLIREASGKAQTSNMEALVTLLDTATRRLASIEPMDPRLLRLWAKVEGDLAYEWSATKLAKLACMSEEHLRRLCHKYYQRSPVEFLTQLRLRRASTWLHSSPIKIEEIAQRVGYASVYSFSAAFRRWSGIPPGRFRNGGVER